MSVYLPSSLCFTISMNEMYFYFYLLAIYWQNFAEQPFRYLSFKNDLGKLGAWKDVAVKLLLFLKGLHLIQLAQPTLTLNQHPNASFQKSPYGKRTFLASVLIWSFLAGACYQRVHPLCPNWYLSL